MLVPPGATPATVRRLVTRRRRPGRCRGRLLGYCMNYPVVPSHEAGHHRTGYDIEPGQLAEAALPGVQFQNPAKMVGLMEIWSIPSIFSGFQAVTLGNWKIVTPKPSSTRCFSI